MPSHISCEFAQFNSCYDSRSFSRVIKNVFSEKVDYCTDAASRAYNYWCGTRLKRTLKRVRDPNHNNSHDTAATDLAILVNSMNLRFEIINILGLFRYSPGEWRTHGLTNFEAR